MIAELVSLRPVRTEDEDFLLKVYGSTREEELAMTDWTPEQKREFVQMQFRAQRQYYEANYPGAEFQVISFRNEPAGRLYTCRMERELRIMDIALIPEYRQRGIGTFLLKQIQAAATKENEKVGIHVEVFNRAIRLYEKLGFKKTADKGVYWFLEWTPADSVEIRNGGLPEVGGKRRVTR